VKHDGILKKALDGLVADGTITQEQADKVLEATKAEGKRVRTERKAQRAETLKIVADALGSTPDEVGAAMKDGTTIAEQAEAAGVDRAVIEKALAAHLDDRIDAAVSDGTMTAERAAKAKEHSADAAARIVDGFSRHRRGRPGN